MAGPQYSKVADLQVKDGTYTSRKDGREYANLQTVGAVFSTPHGSAMFIKLYASAGAPSRVLGVKMVEGKKLVLEADEEVEDGGN